MCCVGSGCGSPRLCLVRGASTAYGTVECPPCRFVAVRALATCLFALRSSSLLGSCGSIDRDKIHAHTTHVVPASSVVHRVHVTVCLSRLTSPRVTTGLRTAKAVSVGTHESRHSGAHMAVRPAARHFGTPEPRPWATTPSAMRLTSSRGSCKGFFTRERCIDPASRNGSPVAGERGKELPSAGVIT